MIDGNQQVVRLEGGYEPAGGMGSTTVCSTRDLVSPPLTDQAKFNMCPPQKQLRDTLLELSPSDLVQAWTDGS